MTKYKATSYIQHVTTSQGKSKELTMQFKPLNTINNNSTINNGCLIEYFQITYLFDTLSPEFQHIVGDSAENWYLQNLRKNLMKPYRPIDTINKLTSIFRPFSNIQFLKSIKLE